MFRRASHLWSSYFPLLGRSDGDDNRNVDQTIVDPTESTSEASSSGEDGHEDVAIDEEEDFTVPEVLLETSM